MVPILIDTIDDPRIAVYRNLKATNETRWTNQFIVEGVKLVQHLLTSRHRIASALCVDSRLDELPADWLADVPVYAASKTLVSEIAGFRFHLGMLASGFREPLAALEVFASLGDRSILIVCPELTNPENLGTLARIGEALGADAILLSESGCPDPLSRRALRVSMGSTLRLPILSFADLPATLDRLKDEMGFELMATVPRGAGAEPLHAASRPDRLALVFGNESDGLPAEWVERCGRAVMIPMRPGADSLNVAVAAGIILHHFHFR